MDRGRTYYNEIDPFCAQWLRNLISTGLIPPGDVDQRDIREVSADDITDYRQCHFFAGIGGWARALRLASWEDNRRVWTGSCPCQPFSVAGKRRGNADERHLWPEWFRLIRECRPPIVFGEQVAAAIALGWLDEAFDDLEGAGYACAAAVLPACAVEAPHRRERLWFMAGAEGAGIGRKQCVQQPHGASEGALGHPYLPKKPRLREHGGAVLPEQAAEFAGARSFSRDVRWIDGADGKARPVKHGVRLLADGIPARLGKLRAYGNAIVPPLAAEFIRSAREVMEVGDGSR